MKLIHKEDVWERMKQAKAVDRAWAWFQKAMGGLTNYVGQVPELAKKAFDVLELQDIILLPVALGKVAAVFGDFVGKFTSWAGETVWNLLEIIFDVVQPGALEYVKRTGAALRGILDDPIPFVGNLVSAAKLGFQKFADHFGEHLKRGLLTWLTGALPGVYIPKELSLGEMAKFLFSVLGISWQNIRQKLVAVVGDKAVEAMEAGFGIVKALVTEGPASAWEQIKGHLSDLKNRVISGIQDFIVGLVVKQAVPQLVSMFVPGLGFLGAVKSIYDTIKTFVKQVSKIGRVVVAFVDSIVAIASGNIEGTAKHVESILEDVLSLAINFFAGFLGMDDVADEVMAVIKEAQALVDEALDTLIAWIVKMAKQLFAKAFGKKDEDDKKPDERTDEQKKDDVQKAVAEADVLLANDKISVEDVEEKLPSIQSKYRLTTLVLVHDSEEADTETDHIEGVINPEAKGLPKQKSKKDAKEEIKKYDRILGLLGLSPIEGVKKPKEYREKMREAIVQKYKDAGIEEFDKEVLRRDELYSEVGNRVRGDLFECWLASAGKEDYFLRSNPYFVLTYETGKEKKRMPDGIRGRDKLVDAKVRQPGMGPNGKDISQMEDYLAIIELGLTAQNKRYEDPRGPFVSVIYIFSDASLPDLWKPMLDRILPGDRHETEVGTRP